MKIKDVIESPMRVKFDDNLLNHEIKFFQNKYKNYDNYEKISKLGDETLYYDSNSFKYFSIDDGTVKYVHTLMPMNNGVRSLSVIKNKSKFKARNVLVDIILPKFKLVFSDKAHSLDGENMWKTIIENSNNKNYSSGIADLSGNILYYFDKNESDNIRNNQNIWGTDIDKINICLFIKK